MTKDGQICCGTASFEVDESEARGLAVFWREEPLSGIEQMLLDLVMKAHGESAFRNNPSSLAVQNSAHGSRDFTKAIASALMTLGEMHGPLVQTAEILSHDEPGLIVQKILLEDKKVPGFGSSFTDSIWDEVKRLMDEFFPEMADKINEARIALHNAGKKIEPNPSAWTAATAIVLKMPIELTPWILVTGRLNSWSILFLKGLAS